MKKYYVQHLKGKTSIIEIEGEIDQGQTSFLKEGEYAFRIAKPASLAGECYMWWSMRDSETEAVKLAYYDIERDLELRVRKGKLKEEEVPSLVLQEKASIEVVHLK